MTMELKSKRMDWQGLLEAARVVAKSEKKHRGEPEIDV